MTSVHRATRSTSLLFALCLLLTGCKIYEIRHQIQGDSKDQIWRTDASQVELRAVQSRVFETTDRVRTVQAVVDTLQDLAFQIEVLDEDLGIVTGKRFGDRERPKYPYDPLYHLYDDENLLVFTRTYRTWGPFKHRSDLVRISVTVRPRNESQLVVRASAQFYLQPVVDATVYQGFFRTLAKSMFVEEQLLR